MANYNKITVNDEVIIDLTQDTITKEKVPSGLTFHDKSGAVQTGTMTAQGAKTITPSTSTQIAVASGVYTTGAVTVAPIPSNYEDVANETNTYTEKLEQLTTAVTALEEELAGKASGGGNVASNMINIDVTVGRGLTVYYLNDNKQICSVQGTSVKGSVFNISAYNGVLYTLNNDPIYGDQGNYICNDSWPESAGTFVMFLENGGTAITTKLLT